MSPTPLTPANFPTDMKGTTAIHCCACRKPLGYVYQDDNPGHVPEFVYCYLCATSINEVALELGILDLSAQLYPPSDEEIPEPNPDVRRRQRFLHQWRAIVKKLESKAKSILDMPE